MAVGPDAMSVGLPDDGSIRITVRVLGVGNWFPPVFASTYSRSAESKARPRTVVSPLAAIVIWPVGVILRALEEPGIGKVLRHQLQSRSAWN